MKNIHVDDLKRKAKVYHKSNKRNHYYENGVLIRHVYCHLEDLARLTWWNDFGFILNDYRVSVAWQHPRHRYAEEIKDLAYSLAKEKYPDNELENKNLKSLFRQHSTPNYKRVGKSRKKIHTVSLNRDFFGGQESERFEESKKIESIIGYTSEVIIVPSINSHWTSRSRFVSVCLPMEIRNETDLITLSSIIKRLLKRETTLDELFPSYMYSKDDWLQEKDQREPNDLHMNLIA